MKSPKMIRETTDVWRPGTAIYLAAGILLAGGALGGCIQVKAPDRPIEINLNVNVRQEVVVRLQQDAENLIENNPELFPQ